MFLSNPGPPPAFSASDGSRLSRTAELPHRLFQTACLRPEPEHPAFSVPTASQWEKHNEKISGGAFSVRFIDWLSHLILTDRQPADDILTLFFQKLTGALPLFGDRQLTNDILTLSFQQLTEVLPFFGDRQLTDDTLTLCFSQITGDIPSFRRPESHERYSHTVLSATCRGAPVFRRPAAYGRYSHTVFFSDHGLNSRLSEGLSLTSDILTLSFQ